jgi:multiple sugar transport system substrate-binding protein
MVPKRAIITILATIGVIGLFVGMYYLVRNKPQPKAQAVQLKVWGIDSAEEFTGFLGSILGEKSEFAINYVKKDPRTYDQELLRAMAKGKAPDIFFVKNSRLYWYNGLFTPAPNIDYSSFKDKFVDVVEDDFVDYNTKQVNAIPLYIDTLAMYWNKTLFNNIGQPQPPKTWDEFLEVVKHMTVKDPSSLNISVAGAAMGLVDNVSNANDIIYTLMMQYGSPMNLVPGRPDVSFGDVDKAIKFYLDFANSNKTSYTWNNQMHNSFDLFAEGSLGMMFDYHFRKNSLREKNPALSFAIAPMPQIKDSKKFITYADYWGLAVWSNSLQKEGAWRLLNILTSEDAQKKYIDQFKRPTAMRSLIDYQKNDPDLGIFATQSLIAKSWTQIDDQEVSRIMTEALQSVIDKSQSEIDGAIKLATDKINLMVKIADDENANL